MSHVSDGSREASTFDEVLTQAEACKLMRVSDRTLQRLDETGEGPGRIQLTERRVGYWRRDVMAWLQARTIIAKTTTRAA